MREMMTETITIVQSKIVIERGTEIFHRLEMARDIPSPGVLIRSGERYSITPVATKGTFISRYSIRIP